MFCEYLTVLIISLITSEQYIEVIHITKKLTPNTYKATLINQDGKEKEVILTSKKLIKVKYFTRATVRLINNNTVNNNQLDCYQLIYTVPNGRQATRSVGQCSWGKELLNY